MQGLLAELSGNRGGDVRVPAPAVIDAESSEAVSVDVPILVAKKSSAWKGVLQE